MDTGRNCMSDRIRNAIASRIYDGTLLPGTRLLELELAREFDTSQTPVREALRELESLRLVESKPYRGTRVRAISNREMAEAYEVRGALERLAAILAVQLRAGTFPEIRQALDGITTAAEQGDAESYARHNLDFHRLILVASGNTTLLQTWESLAFETRMRISIGRSTQDLLRERVPVHAEILQALERGDGEAAGTLLQTHSAAMTQFWRRRPPERVIHDDEETLAAAPL